MYRPTWRKAPRWTAQLGVALSIAACGITLATPAFADTPGPVPDVAVVCGPTLDGQPGWIYKHETLPGSTCAPHTYAYAFTSGSVRHTASWPMHVATPGGRRGFHVEAWIPSLDAGQHVLYSVEYCQSIGRWESIGTLFEEDDSGWFTPGEVFADPSHTICSLREQNTGTQSWDMAADVVGLLPL